MAFCSQHGKLIFIQTFNIKHLFLKLLMLLLNYERLYTRSQEEKMRLKHLYFIKSGAQKKLYEYYTFARDEEFLLLLGSKFCLRNVKLNRFSVSP